MQAAEALPDTANDEHLFKEVQYLDRCPTRRLFFEEPLSLSSFLWKLVSIRAFDMVFFLESNLKHLLLNQTGTTHRTQNDSK